MIESKRVEDSAYRHLRLRWPGERAFVGIPLLQHVFLRVKDSTGVFLVYYLPWHVRDGES